MPVTWVGAVGNLCPTHDTSGSSLDCYGPALQNGDALFAVLFADGTLNVPTGWTKLAELSEAPSYYGSDAKKCFLLRKNTVAATAEAWYTFTRSGGVSHFSGAVFGARGVVSISEIKQATTNWYARTAIKNAVVPLQTATATEDGELHVLIGLSYFGGAYLPFVTVPAGSTRWSQPFTNVDHYQWIGGAFIARNNGQSSSGNLDLAPTSAANAFDTAPNAIATFTLRLSPTSGAPATVDARIEVATPLGASSALGLVAECVGVVAVASPLGSATAVATHDFYAFLSDDPRHFYTMQIQTSAGAVRVPISSWQATLHVEDASFVQCVVPAADQWVDELGDADSFVIFRKTTLLDGREIEAALASAPLQTLTFAQGGFNSTATLQGYLTDLALDQSAAATPLLRDVQTVFTYASGIRVRCAIDWQLRPGMMCYYGATPVVVEYINYYVTQGQAYMDVGGT